MFGLCTGQGQSRLQIMAERMEKMLDRLTALAE